MQNDKAISILIVEDNVRLRNELADFLRDEGFQISTVSDGVEMNAALERQMPAIVILDLNLPGEDGISIATRLRKALPRLGLIMLTARVRSVDRSEGYSAGADVYLTKPTNPEEITQVIRNLYARLEPAQEEASWVLDTGKNQISLPDESVLQLTSLETLLIKELILHGKYISHEDMMHYVGNPNEGDAFNKSRIEVLISRLRKKISAVTDPNMFIKVLRGRGYQLLVPIVLRNLAPSGKSVR
jgi:DNA-binding response OmpR family regulator